MINILWAGMFLCAIVVALYQLIFLQNYDIFSQITHAIFQNAQSAVEISIGLIGILSFWLGILKLIENSHIAEKISDRLTPLFRVLMKDVPANSPAISTVVLNMSANFLGLDNAATPMGLKAMEQLQTHNPTKDEASDAQILFMILNASSVTLIPITIFMYRAQMGAVQPTDIFIPTLLTTTISTLVGVAAVSISQRLNLFCKPVLILLGCIALFFSALIWLFVRVGRDEMGTYSTLAANIILFSIILLFIVWGLRKKINVYDAFIEGAKEGFSTAVRIIPYLVAFLVGIAVFRASGAMDMLVNGIGYLVGLCGIDTSFVGALPTALMKSLSGSAANGLMIDTMKEYGADSFVGRMSCVARGASDTTFYILAVYFGSVGISRTRNAVTCGLIADFSGIIAAIIISYLFFAR